MQDKSELNLKEIGARFRSVRSLININRKTFCERHSINKYTLQSWENGLHVSKGKNIEKFIDALAKEGILCNIDWLMDGEGEPPRSLSLRKEEKPRHQLIKEQSDIDIVKQIVSFYREKQNETLMMQLLDDHMAPKFAKGDIVIGKKAINEIKAVHQKDCIIDLGLDRLIVRRALIARDKIMLLSLDQSQPTFVLGMDARIFPIVWHWIGNNSPF